MAENETKDVPETAESTPSSQHAAATGLKAPKDRSCPFCGQAFTSSSLGRHLDLYIKPKNPKPPDGVHDVTEIKKLRGGITRRQPKTSLKSSASNSNLTRHDSDEGTPSAGAGKSQIRADARMDNGSPTISPINVKEGDVVRSTFNAPNWQATGVINNIPPRPPSRDKDATPTGQAQRIREMRRDNTGSRVQRPDYQDEGMWKLQEAAEVGRAAELALREVLSSLEAAKKKLEPKAVFDDIDFFSYSFPGLCLALLSAPSTLFTPTPFPSGDSWPISPPGQRQFEALNRLMQERTREARQGERIPQLDTVVFKHNVHLQGAYEHWQCMSEQDRASAWSLETLRAYASMTEQKSQLRQELEASQTRIRHLEEEFERLSRCQLPREYLLHPPNTLPVPAAVLKEAQTTLVNSSVAGMDYDVEALLNKWRTTAKATRRRPAPPTVAGAPVYNPDHPNPTHDRNISEDMVMNGSVWAVNGALPRGTEPRHDVVREYETPPQPGAIVDAEDEDDAGSDADAEADADADGDAEDDLRLRDHADKSALARRGPQSAYAPTVYGVVNANGKRPAAHGPTNGRAVGAKVLKEVWARPDSES